MTLDATCAEQPTDTEQQVKKLYLELLQVGAVIMFTNRYDPGQDK